MKNTIKRPASPPAMPPLDPQRYAPSEVQPLRGKQRLMAHQMNIEPHEHDWGQLVFSITGAVRVSTEQATPGRPKFHAAPSAGMTPPGGRSGGSTNSTYIVPPSRAVWIPPGVRHAVSAIERADLRTLYLLPGLLDGDAWQRCRVLEVPALLRELVLALPTDPAAVPDLRREAMLTSLIVHELGQARTLRLGIELPQDKRLRRLCEAMLDAPGRLTSLDAWAAEVGASPRTVSRLFRDELGTSYAQWRSQVLLAYALSMAAKQQPMSHIAAELGYASASAFTAMVTRTVGMPPSRFFAEA